MENKEKYLLNNDEIKVDVSKEDLDEEYSDDFYYDEDECRCGCNCGTYCECGEDCDDCCDCGCCDYDEELKNKNYYDIT